MEQLTNALAGAQTPDQNVRSRAEAQLKQFENADFPQFLKLLTVFLKDASKPAPSRQLAGITLKNCIYNDRDETKHKALQQRWRMVQPEMRAAIRQEILTTLETEDRDARKTAAVVVAKIAACEIPAKMDGWSKGELIVQLLRTVKNPKTNPGVREAVFITLGYVCAEEDLSEHLYPQANSILDAVAFGMRREENNVPVKLAATRALCNCADFISRNMQHKQHRQMILGMIFAACTVANVDIKVAAFQCLVELAERYYEHLADHIESIFRLSHSVISKALEGTESPEVAMRAIEFWSTTSEEECEILEEIDEAQRRGGSATAKRENKEYVGKALKHLAELLLRCMCKDQHEDPLDETWNMSMAAACCLKLVAEATRDNVVQHVLQFVKQNIENANWRLRDAAILAFGSILRGPNKKNMGGLVQSAFNSILKSLKDVHPCVRDSGAWTLGRICSILPEATQPFLQNLMAAFEFGLKDKSPRIASSVCWAIHNLAEAVEGAGPTNNPLTPYFEKLVACLLTCANRPDTDEANLLQSSYEALNSMVLSANEQVLPVLEKLLKEFMIRLDQTFKMTVTDQEARIAVQALLCGSLQVIIQQISEATVKANAQNLMELFRKVLAAEANKTTVHEEVLMAIGAVANKTGEAFASYMDYLKQILLTGLRSTREAAVLKVTVGVVGDVCQALGSGMTKYCDDLVSLLLQNLQDGAIERRVKPDIIACFGDMALAVGSYFERYLPYVGMMFMQATKFLSQLDMTDEDNAEYVNAMRCAILESYTGIIQGLNDDKKVSVFVQSIPAVLELLESVSKSRAFNTPDVITAAVGVILDLATTLDRQHKQSLKTNAVDVILQIALTLGDEDLTQSSQHALSQLKGQ